MKNIFLHIFILSILIYSFFFYFKNEANAQYDCGGGTCPADSTANAGRPYTTKCKYDCDVTPNDCWSSLSCSSDNPCSTDDDCRGLTPACGASCSTGTMKCDTTTSGCYSDCSSCPAPTPTPTPIPACAPTDCTYTQANSSCTNDSHGGVEKVTGYSSGGTCNYSAQCSTVSCCADNGSSYPACGYDLTTICGTSSTDKNTYIVQPNSCGAVCTNQGAQCGQCGNAACPTNTPVCSASMGQSCGNCGGTVRCDGSCSVATPSNYGTSCGSCGGTIKCDGTCSVATPSNYGLSCSKYTSTANVCGQYGRSDGTYDCNGCNASDPVAVANPGTCTKISSANACGQTNTTTGYSCPSGCTASDPSTPANPATCSATSGANACGQTNTNYGYQCPNGCTATTPSAPDNPAICTASSAVNSCGDQNVNPGYNCPNGCTATTPSNPLCIKGNVCDDKSVGVNGIKDTGDLNRVGDTLDLNNNAKTTTTDISGNYAFHYLSSGTYTDRLTVASGFSSVSTNPLTFTNMTTDQTNANFCISQNYTCSGTIYNDVNNNDVYDAGVDTIFTDSAVTVGIDSTHSTTSNTTNGTYSISNLVNGSYTAKPANPTGYWGMSPVSSICSISNANATGVNFLVKGFGIWGTVYEDKDVPPNGAIDSPPDANYQGATVTLTLPGGSTKTTTSDANGDYIFNDLKTGTYTVALTDPAGYTSQYSGSQSNPRTIVVSQSIVPFFTANFGIAKYYTISGTVYKDMNASGAYESATDTAYSGITVDLYPSTGVMDATTRIERRTTDASGNYTFGSAVRDVINGSYRVQALLPSGLKQTYDITNTPAATDTHATTVTNANVTGINFLMQGYKLSAFVYEDKTTPYANFFPDLTDPVYQGASIDLLNSGGIVIRSIATDANGNSVFVYDNSNNLIAAGNYSLRINAITGYRLPTPATVTRTVGPDTSANFALLKYYTVSGTLYNDVDDDSTINAGDTPFIDGSQTITIEQTRPSPDPAQTAASSIVNGTYSFTANVVNGVYNGDMPLPTGYQFVLKKFPGTTFTVANGNVTSVNFLIKGFSIIGHSYTDWNQDQFENTGNAGYLDDAAYPSSGTGATITLSGGYIPAPITKTTTSPTGSTTFKDLKAGPTSYTVALTLPTGYTNTTVASFGIALAADTEFDFGITPLYTLDGNVYVDKNKNKLKDASDPLYTDSDLTVSNFTLTTTALKANPLFTFESGASKGSFTVTGVTTGTYTFDYGPAPSGYEISWPLPARYDFRIGGLTAGCAVTLPVAPNQAGCTALPASPFQNITNLYFGIHNSYVWFQCQNADCRNDSGYSVQIPPNAQDKYASIQKGALSNTPGLIFSGNVNPDFWTAGGDASERKSGGWISGALGTEGNWKVGGTNYSEKFIPSTPNVIRTSYTSYIAQLKQSGITASDLTPYCSGGLTNCTLDPNLPNGIYQVNGNLTITLSGVYKFAENLNYVFLVSQDLKIQGPAGSKLLVPNSSTATFSVAGNITIDKNIGESSSVQCVPPATGFGQVSTGCDIEGYFTTDKNLVVEGTNDCTIAKDKRINFGGVVIVNANLSGGGSVDVKRDLCEDNLVYPTYTFTERPDFFLNAPDFIKKPSNLWQEIAP